MSDDDRELKLFFTMPRVVPMRISIRDCIVLIVLCIFNTIHVTDMSKYLPQ